MPKSADPYGRNAMPTKPGSSKEAKALKANLYAKASKGSSPSASTRSAAYSKNKKGYQGREIAQDYFTRTEVKSRFKTDQNTMKVLKSGKNKNAKKNKY